MAPQLSSGTPSAASLTLIEAAREIKHVYVDSIKQACGMDISKHCPKDEQIAAVIEKHSVEFICTLATISDACKEEDPGRLA